jgi:hypothetical protein
MMLSGRLPVRRGLVVTLGCFILFGAPAIARGIMGSATALAGPQPVVRDDPTLSPPPSPISPAVDDPYAGASVSR